MNKYWAYLHTDRTYKIKVYFDKKDLKEATTSPFVTGIFGPWECDRNDVPYLLLEEIDRRSKWFPNELELFKKQFKFGWSNKKKSIISIRQLRKELLCSECPKDQKK